VFVSKGPYRLIRHPMYSSIFLFVIPEIIAEFSLFRLLFLMVLILALLFKMNYEENRLVHQFDEYPDYQKKTHRIIPYIY
ncbi:MAG: isoprenylcysteine carboxylmethyltransferase family protein, partial [Bacteroidales bacterium]|nr:isoprenylcysteine carboxylmethyltransferase family protein [Bacteroidales bacterium]